QVRATAADINRLFPVRGPEAGSVQLAGSAQWSVGSYSAAGNLHLAGVAFRQQTGQLRNVRADAAFELDSIGIRVNSLRLAGEGLNDGNRIPFEGGAAQLTLRGNDLDARGLAIAALGGSFAGDARLRAWNRFEARGDLRNLEARRAVGVYSHQPLPWNSLVSGWVEIQGSVRQKDLRVTANLAVAPRRKARPSAANSRSCTIRALVFSNSAVRI